MLKKICYEATIDFRNFFRLIINPKVSAKKSNSVPMPSMLPSELQCRNFLRQEMSEKLFHLKEGRKSRD